MSTISFDVNGAIGSKAPNDAVVNAHRSYPNTAICGSVKLTVWWTSYAEMRVAQGTGYGLDTPLSNAYFHPLSTNIAVRLHGQYTLNPAGANFSGFGFGIMQNFRSSGYYMVLDNPIVKWGTAAKGQTLPPVDTTIINRSTVPIVANDCLPGAWPLYGSVQAATGGVNVTDNTDGPGIKAGHQSTQEFRDTTGNLLATVTWQVDSGITCDARDWVVTYLSSTREIFPAAESNWTLDVSHPNTLVQKARNGSSHAVQIKPIVGTASTVANEILKSNQKYLINGKSIFTR